MAPPAATRADQGTTHRPTLFLACELGVTTWKLGFTTGMAQRPRERMLAAGDIRGLEEEMTRASGVLDDLMTPALSVAMRRAGMAFGSTAV